MSSPSSGASPVTFLREATRQDLEEILRTTLQRLNALEVAARANNGSWGPFDGFVYMVNPPSMVSSGIARPWNGPRPVTVYVTGGTVTQISITGKAWDGSTTTQVMGLTSGTFRLVPGDSITLTYSVAPTWRWYGD